jgi:3'(2'), 5'-bisphosphate nucleotidase
VTPAREEPRGAENDHRLAARLAEAAGRLLMDLRDEIADPTALKAAGDARANELILSGLAEARPDDPVLSEESPDDDARLGAPRVWIVDPLDGTREYGEGDRTDWAVHVALAERGVPTVGAVALPARGLVLSAVPAPVVPARPDGPIRLLVSRSRPPALADHLAATLGAELVPMGSAGAKAMAVVLGDGDVYAHSGGQYQWDSAAPVAVAVGAGLHASRLDGSPLVYGAADPWLPDLLICRQELASRVQAALRDAPPS